MHAVTKIFIVLSVFLTLTFARTVFADDCLKNAIKNGTLSGEVKIWYQTNDKDTNHKDIFHKENSIFDAGLRLGYISDTFYGFGAGINFYAVDDLGAFDNFADKSVHNVYHGETGSWLGEAYLTYNKGNTMVKAGRQNIGSPLVNSDDWALFPNNFEACLLQNSDLPDTTIKIAYVTEERTLANEEFEDIAEDGLLMLGVVNKSLPGSTLSAYYYNVDDVDNTDAVYLEANMKLNILNLAGQYIFINTDAASTNETNAFGAKVGATLGMFDLSVAYSSVDDGTIYAAKISDNGIKTPLYTATISGDGDIAGAVDTDSYKIDVSVKPLEGLKLIASYGYYDHGNDIDLPASLRNQECDSAEFVIKYTGIKDVSMFLAYVNSDHSLTGAWSGSDKNDNLNSVRFWAKYEF
jgi:hypothetical protein